MLGIVVACVHCIAIASAINPSPPSEFPAVFLGCPSPFSRREMVKGYKEFSRRESKGYNVSPPGQLGCCSKDGLVIRGGWGGQTESE
jgi:hypothetical protein